jgi:UDP-glucose 4-epimerase
MDLRDRTFVVTGASGFLGGRVLARLRVAGADARGVSRSPGADARVADYADLAPRETTDVLLHLADARDVAAAEAAGEAHVAAARDLAAALARKGWRYAIFASSAIVYGDAVTHPRREDEPPSPGGVYARAKLAGEAAFRDAGHACARLANLYGPGMAPNSVLGDVLAQIPGDGPLAIRDAGPVRDFLWVDDAADALIAMAAAEPRATLNVGTGVGTSAGDLARRALARAGQGHRALRETAPARRASHLVLDSAAAARATGWRAVTPLDEGLSRMLEHRR